MSYSWKLNFIEIFSKNSQISNSLEIHDMGAEFSMRADGWTDRHGEAKSPSHNFANAHKNLKILNLYILYNIKRQILDWGLIYTKVRAVEIDFNLASVFLQGALLLLYNIPTIYTGHS